MVSAEFQRGLELLNKFIDPLKEILDKDSKEEIKKAIEPIKHPVLGATFQIKVGEGINKEELLSPLYTICSQFRKLNDTEALKEAIRELAVILEKTNQKLAESQEEKS